MVYPRCKGICPFGGVVYFFFCIRFLSLECCRPSYSSTEVAQGTLNFLSTLSCRDPSFSERLDSQLPVDLKYNIGWANTRKLTSLEVSFCRRLVVPLSYATHFLQQYFIQPVNFLIGSRI
jgi:hypothetical protein